MNRAEALEQVARAARQLHQIHDRWADGDPRGEVEFQRAMPDLFVAVQWLDAADPPDTPIRSTLDPRTDIE